MQKAYPFYIWRLSSHTASHLANHRKTWITEREAVLCGLVILRLLVSNKIKMYYLGSIKQYGK